MDYDKEEMDRKLREADDVKFFCSKEGWSEGAICKEDRKSFTYNAVKNTAEETMSTSKLAKDLLKKFDDAWVSPPRLGELSVDAGGVSYNAAEYFDFYSKPCEFKPLDFTVRDNFTLTRKQIDNIIGVLGSHTVARNGRNNDDVLTLISNLEALIDE